MPSMLCRPRRAARTQGTLGRVSRHSRRRGRPSARALLLDAGRLELGTQGGAKGDRRGHGIAEEPGGLGAAGGVRSVERRAPCPLRPRLPAAGTLGEVLGKLQGQSNLSRRP